MNRPVYRRGMEPAPKQSEPVFLADLDGSLADFDGGMRDAMELLRSPTEPAAENMLDFTGHDDPSPWIRARRGLVKRQPGFWRNLKPIPEGFEILAMAQKLGFQRTVLTHGPSDISAAWAEKLDWCREHVPDLPVTVTRDKGLIYGRVLYDDWPKYAYRWLEWRPRGLVVMLEHPWNRDIAHPNIFIYRRGLWGPDLQDQNAALKLRLIEARDR